MPTPRRKTTQPAKPNPYHPSLVQAPNGPTGAASALSRSRFRWRVVSVTALYLYGGSLLLVALLSTIHTCIWFVVFARRGVPIRFSWVSRVTTSAAVAMVLGVVVIYAGQCFWKSHWKQGLYAIAAAAILYLAFDAVGGKLIGI